MRMTNEEDANQSNERDMSDAMEHDGGNGATGVMEGWSNRKRYVN